MKFTVITLFEDTIQSLKQYSIIGKAIKDERITLKTINIRDFGLGSYRQVDDRPYGGGVGMLFRVDVISKAIKAAKSEAETNHKVILLCPTGEKFNQKKVLEYKDLDELIIVCGHYEGFDRRIYEYVDETVSVGDYVLSGGEIAAMAIIDSVSRYVDGVLGNKKSLDEESFSQNEGSPLEYLQYTRPEEFEGKKVPAELLSGDPKKITEWQRNNKPK